MEMRAGMVLPFIQISQILSLKELFRITNLMVSVKLIYCFDSLSTVVETGSKYIFEGEFRNGKEFGKSTHYWSNV